MLQNLKKIGKPFALLALVCAFGLILPDAASAQTTSTTPTFTLYDSPIDMNAVGSEYVTRAGDMMSVAIKVGLTLLVVALVFHFLKRFGKGS